MRLKAGKIENPEVELLGRCEEELGTDACFFGEKERTAVLFPAEAGSPYRVLVKWKREEAKDPGFLRAAFAEGYKKAREYRKTQIQVFLPAAGGRDARAAGAAAEGILLADYGFPGYKTGQNQEENGPGKEPEVFLWSESWEQCGEQEQEQIWEAIREAQTVAGAINKIRPLIEMPPNLLYPETLADFALQLGKEAGFSVEVLKEKEIEDAQMGGLSSVGRGTNHTPRFIIMRYHGNPGGRRFVLVGKGITCDTGGYCLKNGEALPYIKGDMAGAAQVMGILAAAAASRLQVNVTALVPSAENVIDGNSYKPGDVVTTLSGQTVEILNTDCEGRMLLADALTYGAREEQADFLLDIATLTGLAGSMFGSLYTPVFASDEKLYQHFMEAAAYAGEDFWRMPLDGRYKSYIEGSIADLKNMAGAGTITAAVFLQQFTEGKPWLHLDIAATAIQNPPVYPYAKDVPSGAGVRTVYQMLKEMEEHDAEGEKNESLV